MVFAIIDYYRYKYRLAHYSHDQMTDAGWKLACESKFPNEVKHLPAETFVVSTTNSFVSWLVMYYTNSVASHVAMMDGKGNVLDCTTSGIVSHPFSDYLDEISYIQIVTPENATLRHRNQVVSEAKKHLGKKYSWHVAIYILILRIIGVNNHYTWKYVIDFLMLFSCLSIFSSVFIKIFFCYLILVIFIRSYRKILGRNTIHEFDPSSFI